MSDLIESAIQTNNWVGAQGLIRGELRRRPEDHWLLTRLALTYYEQHRYRKALEIGKQALDLAPHCPLVLWDYAGALQMVGRDRDAVAIYQRLVRRGVDAIANGPCGEGRGRARSLVADSLFRMARSLEALGKPKAALNAFATHLDMRGPGCRSIYSLKEVSRRQERIRNGRAPA
jgi:tetratricopeptide (TPR) repeat protein